MRRGGLRRGGWLGAVLFAAPMPALGQAAVPTLPPASAAQVAPAGTSLEQSIRLTLRRGNDAIRIQDEKVRGAEAQVKQAAGAFDWMVTGEGGYETLYVPRVAQGLLPNGHGVLTDQTDSLGTSYVSGGIGRTFRNGISVRPGVTAYPGSTASVAQTMGQTKFRPTIGIQIPLLRGLGETSADAMERAAQETLKGTTLARDFAVASLVNDTVQIYWRCQADDMVARNTGDFDRRASAYEDSLNKLAARGLLEPTVAEQAQAAAVARHLSVRQAENAVADCRRELAAAMGTSSAPTPTDDAAPAMASMEGPVNGLDAEKLVAMALANRADVKAAEENVAAAQAKVDGARDATTPSLNLNIEPDRAILRYSQSLENNTGEGLQEEADAAAAQARLALSQLQAQVRQQVSVTVRNLKSAYADWKALSAAARQMDVVVIDAGGRAKLGVITRDDLVSAQRQAADIKNQAADAQLQFLSSLASLRLMTGTLHPDSDTPAALAAKFVSPAIVE